MAHDLTRAEMVAKLQARVARNAFNNWMGMVVRDAGDGMAETEIAWRAEFASTPERGATHGGIIASLMDACCCYAVAAQTGAMVTTVDLRIDYHTVAEQGLLRARADVVRSGRKLATVDSRLFDHSGQLVASGRGTFMHLPNVPV